MSGGGHRGRRGHAVIILSERCGLLTTHCSLSLDELSTADDDEPATRPRRVATTAPQEGPPVAHRPDRRRHRHRGLQHRTGHVRRRLAGPRAVPFPPLRHPRCRAAPGRRPRPRVAGPRAAGPRLQPRRLHDLVAAGDRGREPAGQRRHAGQPARCRRPGIHARARRARHRAQALPRPVRRVRVDARRHAVPGDASSGCRSTTSTTTRRTSSSPRRSGRASPGRCTDRTP